MFAGQAPLLVFAALVSLACLTSIANGVTKKKDAPQMLIISLDGFRFDYYDHFKKELGSLEDMAHTGVHAVHGMTSTFATSTFPAHWSIATGLYQETHGIISNNFFDPHLNKSFDRSLIGREWFGGEPIWATALQQDKRAGVYFWPGFNVDFGPGKKPNWPSGDAHYNRTVKLDSRINQTLDWLIKDKLDLVMAYWEEPDHANHWNGPRSKAVEAELKNIDRNLEHLIKELKKKDYFEHGNLIVLGDHGIVKTADHNASIYLDKYINATADLMVAPIEGPVVAIWPRKGREQVVMQQLRKLQHDDHHRVSVYNKTEIPERWHYKHNVRIPPILIVANEGYVIQMVISILFILVSIVIKR